MQPIALYFVAFLQMASALVWWEWTARLRQGKPALERREPYSLAWSPIAFGIAVVWTLLMALGRSSPPLPNVERLFYTNAVLFLLLLMGIVAMPRVSLSDMGIEFRRLPGQLADGVIGFFATILPVTLAMLATSSLRNDETQHVLLKLLRQNPSPQTITWITVTVVVAAPLAEELMFRVVLQRGVMQWLSPGWAIALVAALFSSIHGWPDMLPLFPLALVLGYVYYQRSSYLTVVIMHALFNFTNLVAALYLQEP